MHVTGFFVVGDAPALARGVVGDFGFFVFEGF